ncbi:MAG: porin family protein [Bacteroidota bacterium]
MPKQRILTLILVFLFISIHHITQAQMEESRFHYGFTSGVTYSTLGDIQTTLIRPIFPEDTYSTQLKQSLGFTAGAFIYYKFEKSKFAIQPEINYADNGGIFHYEDINGLQYELNFKYSYLNIAPMFKFYPVHGFYATAGAQLGIIVNRSALTYVSNQPELGPDLQIQQSLREVLKGNNNVSIILGAGYDTPFGLSINARWVYGISDAIETLANGFYFIENKNPANSFQVTIGYAIPFMD